VTRLVAHLLLHLRLVLLVVLEVQHLRVLLLQVIHNHQEALKNALERRWKFLFQAREIILLRKKFS
jgi:hypothetical protein